MLIRHTRPEDLTEILEIYKRARQFMAQTGNPNQWGDNWPPEDLIREDIRVQKNYVCEENGQIQAVFYFDQGDHIDPTYEVIDGGDWIEEGPYGVVHRIATAGKVKGAGRYCIQWAFEQCHHLRMDTHADNKIMQKLLLSMGFVYCGIIYVREDHYPRYAYEKLS